MTQTMNITIGKATKRVELHIATYENTHPVHRIEIDKDNWVSEYNVKGTYYVTTVIEDLSGSSVKYERYNDFVQDHAVIFDKSFPKGSTGMHLLLKEIDAADRKLHYVKLS